MAALCRYAKKLCALKTRSAACRQAAKEAIHQSDYLISQYLAKWELTNSNALASPSKKEEKRRAEYGWYSKDNDRHDPIGGLLEVGDDQVF